MTQFWRKYVSGELSRRILTRRGWLRLGLTGAAAWCLAPACQYGSKKSGPGTPTTPGTPEPVTVLTDGTTLYDDFDGHGNFQTYDNRDLAEAGRLSSKLWNVYSGWGTGDVLATSLPGGLLTVVNEDGQRVEYRQENSRETMYVFDADGKLIEMVPHTPGRPYHSSARLVMSGLGDGEYEADGPRVRAHKGRIYGVAAAVAGGPNGRVLRLTTYSDIGMSCELCNSVVVGFADNKSFSADVMASSTSTTRRFRVVLDIHATIPEQPPGKSWTSQIGIGTVLDDDLYIVAQCVNVNTGYRFFKYLGEAEPDAWYNLRQDIVTRKEDSHLGKDEFRIDYYVNGFLAASEIPEDASLLLDPRRIGVGPKRILTLSSDRNDGTSVAFLDNVKAVYTDRVG
jgi:hypothetical protein